MNARTVGKLVNERNKKVKQLEKAKQAGRIITMQRLKRELAEIDKKIWDERHSGKRIAVDDKIGIVDQGGIF